jgi:hypothetical protein
MCGAVKPLDEFHNDSRKADGRTYRCKPCAKAAATASRQARLEQVRAYDRERQKLKPRDKVKETTAKHYQKKKAYYRERVSSRRAYMGKATPPWADKDAMLAAYEYAHWLREIGVDAEVDHIIPLYGRNVCGLHVHCNLRVVLKTENRSKNNRIDPALSVIASLG